MNIQAKDSLSENLITPQTDSSVQDNLETDEHASNSLPQGGASKKDANARMIVLGLSLITVLMLVFSGWVTVFDSSVVITSDRGLIPPSDTYSAIGFYLRNIAALVLGLFDGELTRLIQLFLIFIITGFPIGALIDEVKVVYSVFCTPEQNKKDIKTCLISAVEALIFTFLARHVLSPIYTAVYETKYCDYSSTVIVFIIINLIKAAILFYLSKLPATEHSQNQ